MNNLVSVILPVCNGAKTIRTAIDSVLAQTYPHFELVVIDNSDDDTPDIVTSYTDKRILFYKQKSNGSVNGYNEALDEYINGKYITFIHHDDVYYPEKLYEQVRMIEKFVDVDCVYNNDEFVDADLNTIRIRSHEDYYHRNNDLLAVMMIGYGISNLGMHILMKREFIEKHHIRYSLETPVCCDHEILFTMIDRGAIFKHVDKPLYKYRIHDDNYSADREAVGREQMVIYSRYGIQKLKKIVANSNYSQSEQQIIIGKLYYRLGQINEGHKHYQNILTNERNDWAAFYLGTGFYRYQGDFTNAAKWLQQGHEWMPYRAEFINNLGCCIVQMEGASKAKRYFAEALQLMPNYYDAKYNLEHAKKGEYFNPRITDREIECTDQFAIVYKSAEKQREESGSLQPAGNL